jgi:hypothetical protein
MPKKLAKNHSGSIAPQPLQVAVFGDGRKGVYSNLINIQSNKEEFILDFVLVDSPSGGHLVSRVVISREHAKRLSETLKKTLKKKQ